MIYYDTTGGAIQRDDEPERFATVRRRIGRHFARAEANPALEWLAAIVPARRASRINALNALRYA